MLILIFCHIAQPFLCIFKPWCWPNRLLLTLGGVIGNRLQLLHNVYVQQLKWEQILKQRRHAGRMSTALLITYPFPTVHFLSAHLRGQQVGWGEVEVLVVQVYRVTRAAGLGTDPLVLLHGPHLLLLKHTQGSQRQIELFIPVYFIYELQCYSFPA